MLHQLLLLLLLSTSSPAQAADDGGAVPVVNPFSYFCNSTGVQRTFLPNSTFQANLGLMAAALPANASASGFSAGALGAAPGTVYALALCRGDYKGKDCSGCLAMSFQNAAHYCPYSTDVTMYHEKCQLRFSDQNFLSGVDNAPESEANNMNNASAANAAEFDPLVAKAAYDAFVAELLNLIADRAVAAAGNGTTRNYATGMAGFRAEGVNVYGLVQCTPDLTAAQCRSCLGGIIAKMPTWWRGRVGGRILGVRCNLRFERDLFFAVGNDAVVLSPLVLASSKGSKRKLWIIGIVVPFLALLTVFILCFGWTNRSRKGKINSQEQFVVNFSTKEAIKLWRIEEDNSEFTVFDFSQIIDATSNFSQENKLGQGGFGPVYKGRLSDGLEIAVKRLASHSGQGLVEFKNEIQLIAKFQHTNLVRLLGCCIQVEEKILIYEYMPNKSLDFFIFDVTNGELLNWNKRLNIIEGIAQGLLYLHKHSRLRVIHRDLKASNILLDYDMNPKISDFGLAKIFGSNDIEGNTSRVVGTFGYMAPEYVSEGLFSVKSDVFSFGVLLLEIVNGKKNAGFHQYEAFLNLIGYAWQLWKEGRWLDLVDASLVNECKMTEIMRCTHIALLCVQENAADRPTMSDVVAMLNSESISLAEPKQPAYFNVRVAPNGEISTIVESPSINNMTITAEDGR